MFVFLGGFSLFFFGFFVLLIIMSWFSGLCRVRFVSCFGVSVGVVWRFFAASCGCGLAVCFLFWYYCVLSGGIVLWITTRVILCGVVRWVFVVGGCHVFSVVVLDS